MSRVIFDIPFNGEYSTALEFKTNVVERIKGDEQRKPAQFYGLRTFILPLKLSPARRSALEELFCLLKGEHGEFLYRWSRSIGGNNRVYRCYFADDKLEEDIKYLGYSSCSVKFYGIERGNILRNAEFLDMEDWETSAVCTLEDGTLSVSNTSGGTKYLAQNSVMTAGSSYRLDIQLTVSGDVSLDSSVCSLSAEERRLQNGKNSIAFEASGENLKIVFPAGSGAVIEKISLIKDFEDPGSLSAAALEEHTHCIHYSTVKDLLLTSHNNREASYDAPLRRWVLTFQKPAADFLALEEFFNACKGRFRSFNWTYPLSHGGDGQTYRVRFDSDTLEASRSYEGYGRTQLALMEVRGDV